MEKSPDVKKRGICLFLLFGTLLTAGAEFSPSRMLVSPGTYKEHFRDGVLTRTKDMKSVCIYTWYRLKPGSGVLTLKLKYTLTPGIAAKLKLSYRKKEGKNGNAGETVFNLPAGTGKPVEVALSADLPPEADTAQIILAPSHGDASFKLSRLSVEDIPDQVSLPGKCQHFYQAATGKAAAIQTAVEASVIAARALQFRFLLDEPEPELVKAAVEKRDGPLWEDDCAELFIYDPERKRMFQFILNTRGTQFDAELKQAQDGDPWKPDASWDARWEGSAEKTGSGYAVTFRIPFAALGYSAGMPEKLLVNFARERKADNENSMWNAVPGNFNELDNFSELDLKKNIIIRCRRQEKAGYLPVRRQTAGLELLSKNEKGGYWTGTWGLGGHLQYYPDSFRKKYTEKSFGAYRRQYLETLAENHLAGPDLPWIANAGMNLLRELNEKYGKTFPYAVTSTRIHSWAIKKHHAVLKHGNMVDPADPAYARAALEVIDEIAGKCRNPEFRKLVSLGHGIDEPTNGLHRIYSRTLHPEYAAKYDEIEREIKGKYGFGKFGLHDFHGKTDPNSQFRRIAFWRWWNDRFSVYLKQVSGKFRKELPGIPYMAFNRNNCGSICTVDAALLSPDAEVIGTDPYPTSSKVFGGIGRAIYHTGFSVRLLHDLASRSRTCATLQMFIYHGGSPTPEYVREWTSQALKNGASFFHWYDGGPANITIPDSYAEMLRLSKLISGMNRLPISDETRSAILYSDADRWGLDDSQGHPYYCLYVLLGEKTGANFRFVSPTGLRNGLHSLNGISVLYIPRMRYARNEEIKIILDFVRNGGTLVVFDPNLWMYHYDGTAIDERSELIPRLNLRNTGASSLRYKGKKAPVGKIHGIAADAGLPAFFDFPADFNGKVLASYPDGKPAIMERNIGRGRVIVSACQVFGYSSVILEPGAWLDFFRDRCEEAGEKTGLPIWNFVLPAK